MKKWFTRKNDSILKTKMEFQVYRVNLPFLKLSEIVLKIQNCLKRVSVFFLGDD